MRLGRPSGILAIGAMIALAGCASLQSRYSGAETGSLTGYTYMAPTQRLEVIATRVENKVPAVEKARLDYVKAETAYQTAVAEHDIAKEASEKAAARVKDAPASLKAELQKAADLAALTLSEAVAKRDKLKAAQIAGLQMYQQANAGVPASDKWVETIKINVLEPEGDPKLRFAADSAYSPFRSDKGKIITSKGMLQSANLTVTGETGAAVLALAQSIAVSGMTVKGPSSFTDPPTVKLPVAACQASGARVFEIPVPANVELGGATVSLTLDPSTDEDVTRINRELCASGFSLRIKVLQPAALVAAATVRQGLEASTNPICPEDHGVRTCNGLVYRQPIPYRVSVHRVGATGAPYEQQSVSIPLVTGAPLDLLPYSASLFVTRRQDAVFVNGVLTQVDFDRASEARVIAGLPFEALKATGEAIGSVVKLRVDITDQSKKLDALEAEIATLKATGGLKDEVAVAEKQKALLDLRKQILTLENEVAALEASGEAE